MSAEFTPEVRKSQPGKPGTARRTQRGTRNRPVLVTAQSAADATTLVDSEAEDLQVGEPVVSEQSPVENEIAPAATTPRRGPRFFTNIGKSEKPVEQLEADPKAARMARALGKKSESGTSSTKEKEEKEPQRKAAASQAKENTSTRNYTPARPRSGFKMRYIWGMMIYLIIADFLGVWIASFMAAHGLDAVVFRLGPIQASRSTLIFLVILIILLVVMARFDLIPRSLGAALTGANQPGKGNTAKTGSFEPKASQPSIKQGVQGNDDALYQEYRENQRYFQKKDRKR